MNSPRGLPRSAKTGQQEEIAAPMPELKRRFDLLEAQGALSAFSRVSGP